MVPSKSFEDIKPKSLNYEAKTNTIPKMRNTEKLKIKSRQQPKLQQNLQKMLPLQRQQQVFHAPVGRARFNNRRTGDKELDDKVKKSVNDPQEGIREEKNLGAITGDPEQSSPSKRKPTTPGQGDECSKQRWTVQRRNVVRTFSLRTC